MNRQRAGGNNYASIFLFFVLMGFYLIDELIHVAMLSLSSGDYGYSRYYIVGMLLFGIICIIQIQSQKNPLIKLPRAGRVFNLFILTTYLLSILLSFHSSFGLLSDYIARLLPLFALFISYSLFQKVEDDRKIWLCLYVYAIILGYFYVTNSLKRLSFILEEDVTNSSVYFLLYLLPLLLCTNRKLIKVVVIIVTGVFIVLAAKRGGFIAFILGLVVYILVGIILANKLQFKHLLIAGVLLAGIAYGLTYLIEDDSLFIFSRMENRNGVNYGDRGDLYPMVFRMILSSDLVGMILGHGFNSVILDGTMGFSAHNDFLEIWYDFGLIGLISYLIVWFYAVKMGINMIKMKSKYAAPYFFMLSILFVNSNVSHIFLYNQYLLMFSVSLGSMWSLYRREQLQKQSVSSANSISTFK